VYSQLLGLTNYIHNSDAIAPDLSYLAQPLVYFSQFLRPYYHEVDEIDYIHSVRIERSIMVSLFTLTKKC